MILLKMCVLDIFGKSKPLGLFSCQIHLAIFHGFERINEYQKLKKNHLHWEVQSLLDDFLYRSTTLSVYAIMYK